VVRVIRDGTEAMEGNNLVDDGVMVVEDPQAGQDKGMIGDERTGVGVLDSPPGRSARDLVSGGEGVDDSRGPETQANVRVKYR
jgi:hypothetical protein